MFGDGFELRIFGPDGSTVQFNKDYDIKFIAKKEVKYDGLKRNR